MLPQQIRAMAGQSSRFARRVERFSGFQSAVNPELGRSAIDRPAGAFGRVPGLREVQHLLQ